MRPSPDTSSRSRTTLKQQLAIDKQELAAALAEIREGATIERLLDDLLAPSELRNLLLRWRLMKLLRRSVTQRAIASSLGISLCKITRGSRLLKDPDSVVSKLIPPR